MLPVGMLSVDGRPAVMMTMFSKQMLGGYVLTPTCGFCPGRAASWTKGYSLNLTWLPYCCTNLPRKWHVPYNYTRDNYVRKSK